jgi:hypothetical protein
VLSAGISPDGKYLGYADQQGIHLQLVATGGVQSVALPPGAEQGKASWTFGSWFPDSTRFLASASVPGSHPRCGRFRYWEVRHRNLLKLRICSEEGACHLTVPRLPTKGCVGPLERARFG